MTDSPGKVCLLTGATQGIGRAAAESLIHTGMRLILVARDPVRLRAVAEQLGRVAPGAEVETLAGDLSRVAEVRRLAAEFRARHRRLDVLLNNAGATFTRREVTPEGLERTFALNHLAYFVLTQELLPILKTSAPARVVNVSSAAHLRARLDLDDLQYERRRYAGMAAYGQSKLLNVLFTRELARRLEGSGVTVNAMHPGFVRTGFGHNTPGLFKTATQVAQLFARTPEQGARTLVYLATSPAVANVTGQYFFDERPARTSPLAEDAVTARRLWEESERLAASHAAAA
jgi:NAD(P)-dependent dehydrogenase (short-subunit alcohol dehydrogenase family)